MTEQDDKSPRARAAQAGPTLTARAAAALAARRAREAAALRANLGRRKQQGRAREHEQSKDNAVE